MSARLHARCVAELAALVLVLLPGCATYSRVDRTYRHRRTGLEVTLPEGWLHYSPTRPAYTITRDGLRLEAITITVARVGKPIRGTSRRYQPNMLPHEIAELSLGLIEARDDTKNFEIQRIELVELAGHQGYMAEARYYDSGGLPKRLLLYGAKLGEYVCELQYTAAEAVYYDRYRSVFEGIVQSVKVASDKAKKSGEHRARRASPQTHGAASSHG